MTKERARKREAPITADLVVDTALRMIDDDGMDALTMRRLAHELGVEPVTIYRQLPNKETILAAVAERLWAAGPRHPVAPRNADPADWREQVRAMWLSLHALMQEHPNAIPVLAKGGTYSASSGGGTAMMADLFRRAGLSPGEAAELLHIVGACVVGFGFATLWSRQVARGDRPEALAGGPLPTPPELQPYLESIAHWDPRQFEKALDIVLEAYGDRAPGAA